jgi:hypothetical protein
LAACNAILKHDTRWHHQPQPAAQEICDFTTVAVPGYRSNAVQEHFAMSLQDKLNAHKAKSQASRPPEVAATLRRATEELRATGILDHVLKIGARAPAFALPSARGTEVSSAESLKRGPLALSFYRGHW